MRLQRVAHPPTRYVYTDTGPSPAGHPHVAPAEALPSGLGAALAKIRSTDVGPDPGERSTTGAREGTGAAVGVPASTAGTAAAACSISGTGVGAGATRTSGTTSGDGATAVTAAGAWAAADVGPWVTVLGTIEGGNPGMGARGGGSGATGRSSGREKGLGVGTAARNCPGRPAGAESTGPTSGPLL